MLNPRMLFKAHPDFRVSLRLFGDRALLKGAEAGLLLGTDWVRGGGGCFGGLGFLGFR